MKSIDWSKWAKALAVGATTALAVPEMQQALPPKAMPYVNAAIAIGALLYRYQPQEPAPKPQEPPKS